jgi:hypothetical protein
MQATIVDRYRPPRPLTIGNQLVTERGYRLVNINQGRIAMAKRREIEAAGDEGVPDPGNARPNVELPFFASPSISPAGTEAVGETPAEPSEAGGAMKCPRLPNVWPSRRLLRLRTFKRQASLLYLTPAP